MPYCHFVPNMWECENVRLCDWYLRVIFVWPCLMLWFCFPVSQISHLDKSFQKITRHYLPNMWECENVRLCNWDLRVIFFWPCPMLRFCYPVSQISRLNKSFQKIIRHFVPNMWDFENVKLGNWYFRVIFFWPCLMLLSNAFVETRNLRYWEAKSKR